MRTLYLRIYLTVVAALLLFALVAGWFVNSNIEHRRRLGEIELRDRHAAWVDLAEANLPAASAVPGEQGKALADWSLRLGLPLALDDAGGRRISASDSFRHREEEFAERGGRPPPRPFELRLNDGRTLWMMRPRPIGPSARPGDEMRLRPPPPMPGTESRRPGAQNRSPDGAGPERFGFGDPFGGRAAEGRGGSAAGPHPLWFFPTGGGLAAGLAVLFLAVAAGAWPVVRRLTRRLELLRTGVEAFGAGALDRRVKVDGNDEVAAVAASFNVAAGRVEALVRAHQSLLANASHELRSPLARMKMAVSMLDGASPSQRDKLKAEIDTNIRELDALVEEVLLSSRLDSAEEIEKPERVNLLAIAVEEGTRAGAVVEGPSVIFTGHERLLRRALRNLLENALRYGGGDILVSVKAEAQRAWLRVCDRGPGVPPALRERIFEPFYRLPGHAEQAGGVGLGLSLVKQIAERHGGNVHCEERPGGGSCFVISLPDEPGPAAGAEAGAGNESVPLRVSA